MDLHELLATAVDDPPPLPDQVPIATETLRRRRARTRRTLLASACGLAVVAGTATIAAPWRHAGTSAAPISIKSASTAPTPTAIPISPARFARDAASVLQSLWPVPGEQLTLTPQQSLPGRPATQPVQTSVAFGVEADGGSRYVGLIPQRFPKIVLEGFTMNRCNPTPPIGYGSFDYSCASATMSDGTIVLVIRSAGTENGPVDAEVQVWKGHDALALWVDGHVAKDIGDEQFFGLAESSGYANLFAEGEHSGGFAADVVTGLGG